MLAVFEFAGAAVLLWSLILPSQNYIALSWFAGGMAVLWAVTLSFYRSRSLFTSTVFFQFCFVLAFHTRTTIAAGALVWWYAGVLWSQWLLLLWFQRRGETVNAALFLSIVLISPLYFSVLNVRNDSFMGVAFWIFAVAHLTLLQRKEMNNLPWFGVVLFIVSLVPIPFALYYWRSVQFLWIQIAVVLLYCAATKFPKEHLQKVILFAYTFLAFWLLFYALSRDAYTLPRLGPTVFASRHHLLEHANTLAPLYILWSSLLFYSAGVWRTTIVRGLILALLIALGILAFLTYSRSGWIGYAVFLGTYGVLRIWRQRIRIPNSAKQLAVLCIAGLMLVLAVSPVRQMFVRRSTDITSVEGRLFALQLGVQNIIRNPFAGTGWFNYYSHARLSPEPPLKDLQLNRTMRDVHSHSMIVDLAEAGGLPLLLTFFFIIYRHLKGLLAIPIIGAGLIGVTANNVVDTASLWMTVYPHFWILLALIGVNRSEKISAKKISGTRIVFVLSAIIVSGAMTARLIEDHFLQKARFFYLGNRLREAERAAQTARTFAPLDVQPLESLRDIYLSSQNAPAAVRVLEKAISLKKDYAPYYTQLAKLKIAMHDLKGAEEHLKRAETLDPHAALPGNPLILRAHLQFLQNQSEYRHTLFLAMAAKPSSMDSIARLLLLTIPEQELIREAIPYAIDHAPTVKDRAMAMEQIYLALKQMNRHETGKLFLERALVETRNYPGWLKDIFCYRLAEQYYDEGDRLRLEKLSRVPSNWAVPYVKAYLELSRGNFAAARNDFADATTAEDFDIGAWERYWKRTGSEEDLRTFYEMLLHLPTQTLSPGYRSQIANSYWRERNFKEAATQFRRLTFHDYSDPAPHWLEARMWWLAAEKTKAEAANARFMRFVPANSITRNLYRSTIEATFAEHFTIMRSFVENKFGGLEWRPAVYAHPVSRIVLPNDVHFKRISGELAMSVGAWFEKTDGFRFSILNSEAETLFSVRINPHENSTDRRWVPFEWHGKSQNVMLLTSPEETGNYDWALLYIHSAD